MILYCILTFVFAIKAVVVIFRLLSMGRLFILMAPVIVTVNKETLLPGCQRVYNYNIWPVG